MRRWVWLAVLAALVLGVGLGQDRLMRMDDEGLYVRIALEMFQRGDWTVPTWFGGPGWFKPPGLYWSMFPWFALLGPTLLAGRVAALLWGAGTLAVTVAFGCRARGPQAGLLSGLVLLTCCSFVKYSRVGMMEAPLLFFYVAVLYSFYRARLGDGPIWDFLWPALTGVSTLVKGPVTALVLGLTLLFHRGVPWRRGTWVGGVVGMGCVLLWPLMVLWRGVWSEWWSFFIVRENLGKFDNIFYSPLNIWGMFLGHLAPWSLVFLAVAWPARKDPAVRLCGLFIVSLLLFFTLPATRLSWYPVPALPAAALVVGLALTEVPSRARWAAWMTAGLLAVAGVFLTLAPRGFELGEGKWGAWLAAVALMAAAAGFVRQAWGFGATALALAFVGLGWVGACWPFPYLTPSARALLLQSNPPYLVRLSPYAWSYEIGRPATQVSSAQEVSAALARGGRLLVSESDLQAVGVQGYQVDTSWTVMKRSLPAGTLLSAVQEANPHATQESMLVIEQQVFHDSRPITGKNAARNQSVEQRGSLPVHLLEPHLLLPQ